MIELRGDGFGPAQTSWGGDTLNTAVYLARLGRDHNLTVSYATALGTDPFSQAMVEAWEKERLDPSLIVREGAKMPGIYAIQVAEDGERNFFYWRDASAAKAYFEGVSSPLEEALDRLDAVYLSGISLAVLPPEGRERLVKFLERFKARDKLIFFDNNYRARLWGRAEEARRWYDRVWPLCDLALITDSDHGAVYDLEGSAILAHAQGLPPSEVVIKRGSLPTVVRMAGHSPLEIPTFPVDRVVDTTGAGDSFGAGYLAAKLAGASPGSRARSGNKLASLVIQYPGAIIPASAMPEFFFG